MSIGKVGEVVDLQASTRNLTLFRHISVFLLDVVYHL